MATLVEVASSLLLNVAASCGTIFVNKALFANYGFNFGTTLTVCHFLVTFILCVVSIYLNLFTPKRLDIMKVIPISLAFCGYVVFNNISLQYNSVSFYQVMKILCTPVIIVIETVYYKNHTDNKTKLSLLPVCIGIMITVVTDVQINLIGTIFAVIAVFSNSLYTVYGKTKQKELDANPAQLLLYQSITSAVMLIFAIPAFDDINALKEYKFDSVNVGIILLSCFTAYAVNFSFFWLVRCTSPLTVNVVGYLKTIIVFVGGWLFFDSNLTIQNAIGILITLVGVGCYTYVKIQQLQQPPAQPKSQDSENSVSVEIGKR